LSSSSSNEAEDNDSDLPHAKDQVLGLEPSILSDLDFDNKHAMANLEDSISSSVRRAIVMVKEFEEKELNQRVKENVDEDSFADI
jgi:hypothetical protein